MNRTHSAKAARAARHSSLHLLPHSRPAKPLPLPKFASAEDVVLRMKPSEPVHCLRPHIIQEAASQFLASFPGQVMYAVKTNPDPLVLKTAFAAGIRHFDVASLQEIMLVARECPKASMHYMHPVKSRESIFMAYHKFGVRSFSLDSFQELEKIRQMTNGAEDLHLFVRIALESSHAAYSLRGKFGIDHQGAVELLRAARPLARKLGVCFHVGSQCMDPEDYRAALARTRAVIDEAGVSVEAVDVGGGFPSIYPDLVPPELAHYMKTIKSALEEHGFQQGFDVWCEPGRALVAESGSVIVKVELRKGDALYLNDGTYGSLFDAGSPGFIYPTRGLRPRSDFAGELIPFSFFGPTCDSLDSMKGPFLLPSDIEEGDWIEIGGLGAYGQSMRTHFNGFYEARQAELFDKPMLSLFADKIF
jgi:ornithine decarboxylase